MTPRHAQLHDNLAKRVVTQTNEEPWVPTASSGVDSQLLERGGGARWESKLIRFAPGGQVASHQHDGGEELLVLAGTLQDEQGLYGTGCYIRNPPGSRHGPSAPAGCTVLVKSGQFQPGDDQRVCFETAGVSFSTGLVPGLTVLSLHAYGTDSAALVRWAPGTVFQPHRHFGGEEIFVVEGTFQDEHGDYPRGTWIRSPHLSSHHPFSNEGCLIFVKTGHLHDDRFPS